LTGDKYEYPGILLICTLIRKNRHMTYSEFYFPAIIPQWGIFLGVAVVIAGYVEKKELWTRIGWIILIVTGLTSLYFNLFGGFLTQEDALASVVNALKTAGWQSFTGGALAAMALIFQIKKRKSYKILAILTLIYFMLIFFEFNNLARSHSMVKKSLQQTWQGK
jgi:hypothetical protein